MCNYKGLVGTIYENHAHTVDISFEGHFLVEYSKGKKGLVPTGNVVDGAGVPCEFDYHEVKELENVK